MQNNIDHIYIYIISCEWEVFFWPENNPFRLCLVCPDMSRRSPAAGAQLWMMNLQTDFLLLWLFFLYSCRPSHSAPQPNHVIKKMETHIFQNHVLYGINERRKPTLSMVVVVGIGDVFISFLALPANQHQMKPIN